MTTDHSTIVLRLGNGTVVALAPLGFLSHCPECLWTDGYYHGKHQAQGAAVDHVCSPDSDREVVAPGLDDYCPGCDRNHAGDCEVTA